MKTGYRERIYEKYASLYIRQPKLDLADSDRWGLGYDTYLHKWLPADKQAAILDVGCGHGYLLRFLTKRGYTKVTGLDISPEQVALARQIHPDVVQANALEFLEAHKDEFELIIALDVIEHHTKEEIICFLDVCYRALHSSGRLVLQTNNADSLFGSSGRYHDFTHEVSFNPNSLASLMRICGFTAIEAREVGPVPRGFLSFVRWLLWKFVRLPLLAYHIIETGSSGDGILTRNFIMSGVRA